MLTLFDDRREVRFKIVAAVDLWPGYYPQDGPVIVANLNYVFDQMGGQYPYDVWINRDPSAQVDEIVSGVRGLGIAVVDARDAAALIAEEQAQPRRQGLFGLLSVGFIAAGVLTLLGFLISALIAARRRAIDLGRAARAGYVGLSGRRQLIDRAGAAGGRRDRRGHRHRSAGGRTGRPAAASRRRATSARRPTRRRSLGIRSR